MSENRPDQNIDARYQKARQFMTEGRYDEAAQIVDRLLAAQPDQPQILELAGAVALDRNRPHDAVRYFRAAARHDSATAKHWFYLGMAEASGGNFDAAAQAFAQAVAHDPDWDDARFNLAKAWRDSGQLNRAAQAYELLLARTPARHEAVYNLANLKTEQTQYDEAEALYRDLLVRWPDDHDARTNLAPLRARTGAEDEATALLKSVIAAVPDHREATLLLRSLMAAKIAPWHLPMLADQARNDAYDAAIARQAPLARHVLDIGAGSGLLSMMAARAGAGKITACEMEKPLADVARQIVVRNGYADQITVIHKKSTQLQIGDDLDQRADLLITETFDGGLVGEHFLPLLQHARAELLTDDAAIIPAAATIYAALLESDELRKTSPVRMISGFDLRDFDQFRRGDYLPLNLASCDHRFLCDPAPVARLDFKTMAFPPATDSADITVTADGTCHGVAFWFDLHLDDQTTLTTYGPKASPHWRQAVYFFDDDVVVKAGARLTLRPRISMTGVEFDLS